MAKIGTFEITSGKARITDPCYDINTWCSGEVLAKNGKWNAYTNISNEGAWGKRVAELYCIHELHDEDLSINFYPLTKVNFEVGVDSGQAGIYDAIKYANESGGEYDDLTSFYGKVCEQTLSDKKAGILDWGVTSRSGFGDGGYDAFVFTNRYSEAVFIKIVFIAEAEDNG